MDVPSVWETYIQPEGSRLPLVLRSSQLFPPARCPRTSPAYPPRLSTCSVSVSSPLCCLRCARSAVPAPEDVSLSRIWVFCSLTTEFVTFLLWPRWHQVPWHWALCFMFTEPWVVLVGAVLFSYLITGGAPLSLGLVRGGPEHQATRHWDQHRQDRRAVALAQVPTGRLRSGQSDQRGRRNRCLQSVSRGNCSTLLWPRDSRALQTRCQRDPPQASVIRGAGLCAVVCLLTLSLCHCVLSLWATAGCVSVRANLGDHCHQQAQWKQIAILSKLRCTGGGAPVGQLQTFNPELIQRDFTTHDRDSGAPQTHMKLMRK